MALAQSGMLSIAQRKFSPQGEGAFLPSAYTTLPPIDTPSPHP
jgi:hypothetical protein